MLSVIWGILKIIGLLLLILLGVLAALLLLVLFVPVRYSGRGCGCYSSREQRLKGKASVSWLFHLISFRAEAAEDGFRARLRILGIPIWGAGAWKKKKRRAGKRRTKKPAVRPAQSRKEEDAVRETAVLQGAETGRGAAEAVLPEKQEGASGEEVRSGPGETSRKTGKIRGFFRKIRQILQRLVQMIRNLSCTGRKIRDKMKKIGENAGSLLDFAGAPENREVFRYLWEEGKRLLRHILPRRFSGRVRFGMEDPASTGKALMILGILYPVLQDRAEITPVFENENLVEGELSFRGRIRAASLLIIGIRVWSSKQFQKFIRRGQELRRSMSESR